jgi:hypothetical protein
LTQSNQQDIPKADPNVLRKQQDPITSKNRRKSDNKWARIDQEIFFTSMPPKKGTRKNPTSVDESTVPKPMEPEIEVQDLPKPQQREHATSEASNTLPKILLTIMDPDVTPFEIADEYLIELQDLYNTARQTKATNITMEHTTFTKIATTVQKVWEQIKALHRPRRKLNPQIHQTYSSKYRRP